jgi:hypothetical protein
MMYLYHYFDRKRGPFLSVTDLSEEEANKIRENHNRLQAEKEGRKYDENEIDYCGWAFRCNAENEMRQNFIAKGGKAPRKHPYYMVLRNDDMSDGKTFYDGDFIKIPVEEFNMSVVSFTYGDSMQNRDPGTFSDKPYKNQIYTFDEIIEIIKEYGWIKKRDDWNWNMPCYIEAQLWSDDPINEYR